jgi:aminotransferase
MYWVQLDPEFRDAIARDLYARGVYTTFRYPPLHQMPAYGSVAALPVAETAAASTLLLPMHQSLTDEDVRRVVDAVRECVTARTTDRAA